MRNWQVLLFAVTVLLLANLSFAAVQPMVADDDTSAVTNNVRKYFRGIDGTDGKPTTPTVAQYVYHGPMWMKSMEYALMGDIRAVSQVVATGANGEDLSTSATSYPNGVRLTAARLPCTFTVYEKIVNSGTFPHVWLDGWTSSTAWSDTYTTSNAADTSTKFAAMGIKNGFTPSTKLPIFQNGVASVSFTVTTNTLTGTTCSLTLSGNSGIFAGKFVSKSAPVIYIRKP